MIYKNNWVKRVLKNKNKEENKENNGNLKEEDIDSVLLNSNLVCDTETLMKEDEENLQKIKIPINTKVSRNLFMKNEKSRKSMKKTKFANEKKLFGISPKKSRALQQKYKAKKIILLKPKNKTKGKSIWNMLFDFKISNEQL